MNNNNNNSEMDFTEMIKLVQSMSKPAPDAPPPISPVDKLVNNQELRLMKAALPYLNPGSKKNIAVFVKMLELKKTFELFNYSDEITLSELHKTPTNKLDVIKDFRDFSEGQSRNTLNMLYNIMNLQNVLETFNSGSKSFDNVEEQLNNNFEESNYSYGKSTNSNENFDGFINMLNKIIDEKDDGE